MKSEYYPGVKIQNPLEQVVIKDGFASKSWSFKILPKLVLTENFLFFSNKSKSKIFEQIKISDISGVEKCSMHPVLHFPLSLFIKSGVKINTRSGKVLKYNVGIGKVGDWIKSIKMQANI